MHIFSGPLIFKVIFSARTRSPSGVSSFGRRYSMTVFPAGSKSLPPAPAFLSCWHLLFQICGSSPLRYAFCPSDFSPRTVPDGNSCSRRSARSGIPFGISHRAALSLSCHSAPSVPGARNSAGAPLHTSDREVSQPCISILSSAQSVQYE